MITKILDFLKKRRKNKEKNGKSRKSKKVIRKRVVKASFSKVKQEVSVLERHAKELADRLSAIEKRYRENDKNTQVHSRWIEHLNQQVATINNTVSTVTFRVNKLEELPDRLTDLQEQFAALIRAAEREEDEEPLVARVSGTASEAQSRSVVVPAQRGTEGEEEESPLEILTPLTRQAFFVILQMLHESGEDWLPLAQVTARLYPEKEGKKIHNVVANVLRPLYQNRLLEKRRKANYVSLRPTQKGLNAGKDHFKESELKRVEKAFEKIESKKNPKKAA